MRKKLWIKLAPVFAVASMPMMAAACGNKVETVSKLKQDQLLANQKTIDGLEKNWLELTIASLYQASEVNGQSVQNSIINSIQESSDQLYKDAYKAFQFYAQSQLEKDEYTFQELNLQLIKDAALTPDQASTLNASVQASITPDENAFKIYWQVDKSQIRQKIAQILLVYKYFTISNKNELKTIDKDHFKYDINLKFALNNYNLAKYALDKKMVQIWQKGAKATISTDQFFMQGYGFISGPESFNAFLKDTPQSSKMLAPNSSSILTTNPVDLQLAGYDGFQTNIDKYGLFWSYDNLKQITSSTSSTYSLTGYFDPTTNKLLNNVNEENQYSPYSNEAETTDKAIIVYLNQIVPIAQSQDTALPIKDSEPKGSTKNVRLLSFENTPYANELDKLSYIFYLKDDSLYKTAQTAFAKLGYKIKIDKSVSQELYNSIKDKIFIDNNTK